MSWIEITVLVTAGVMVGFINTLAGGGSVISLSVLMLMGLPAPIANGTNRIAITVQTLTATSIFRKQKVLDLKKGLWLGLPSTVGSLIGAWIAVDINEATFEKAFAVIMIIMLVFLLLDPKKLLHGRQELIDKKVTPLQVVIYFFLGIYGGFIHVGIGYLLLAALVLNAGYDLVRANAVKVLIVLMYMPFTLLVFLIYGDVNWKYGLVMTVGNVVGAYIASKMAIQKGVTFVKWVIVIVILLMAGHFFHLYNIMDLFGIILGKTQ